MLTADAILAIPTTAPFRLFPRNALERAATFKKLAKAWHPDAGGRADVFAHISALHDAAAKGLDSSVLLFTDRTNGKSYQFQSRQQYKFELGSMAISHNHVLFELEQRYNDLALNGLKRIGSIRYPDTKMREEHQRYVPNISMVFDTASAEVIIVNKTPDVFLLRDLITHFGVIDPKHVAWIISSLLNLACFYKIIGLCHNGLSVDTVFASPQYNCAFPIGGWWYAQTVGKQLKFLSPSSAKAAPRSILTSKIANHRVDLECIRAIARDCLGPSIHSIPKPYFNFIQLPAPPSPIDDYANWEKTLLASYGPRRFLKLDVNPSDIYP